MLWKVDQGKKQVSAVMARRTHRANGERTRATQNDRPANVAHGVRLGLRARPAQVLLGGLVPPGKRRSDRCNRAQCEVALT